MGQRCKGTEMPKKPLAPSRNWRTSPAILLDSAVKAKVNTGIFWGIKRNDNYTPPIHSGCPSNSCRGHLRTSVEWNWSHTAEDLARR